MRTNNSVGGHRAYPSSPEASDAVARQQAILGQFRDGMDRLRRERELTETEQQRANHLSANNILKVEYRALCMASETLWQLALEKQQSYDQGNDTGIYSTSELAARLIYSSNRWRQFKQNLQNSSD